MLRYVDNPRGALSIHISCKALSGASLEIEFRECAASICLEDGIPGTDGNAALVLFRETTGRDMRDTLSSRRECQRANKGARAMRKTG